MTSLGPTVGALFVTTAASLSASERLELDGGAAFVVEATVAVDRAPHGICFSADGARAWVACSGAGAVLAIDVARVEVGRRLPAGEVPLDVMRAADGALVVTQFRGDELLRLDPETGDTLERLPLAAGGSLFTPAPVDGRRYVVCEFADRVFAVDADGRPVRSWPTGPGPYPAAVAPDGGRLLVPNRGGGSVSVIDLETGETEVELPVGRLPEGGAVTPDGRLYLVACSGDDAVRVIDLVERAALDRIEGVGPRPFSVAVTPDGRYGLVNDAGGRTISVIDVSARRAVGRLEVGRQPIVVRAHPDGERFFVSNEVSGTVSIVRYRRPEAR